jgi:cell division protein FtsQ
MTVRVPTDKRFRRRTQLRPMKRRSVFTARWRRNLTVSAIFVVVLFMGYRIGAYVLQMPVLSIDRLIVLGNVHLSTDETLSLVDGLRGENILIADLEQWRNALLVSPWVKDATLRKVIPSTIKIEISERAPMALGRIDGHLYLIDDQARLIAEHGADYTHFDLPVIDGLLRETSDGPVVIDDQRSHLTMRVMNDLETQPRIVGRVSQIDVSNPSNVVVILDDDEALIHLGVNQFAERLQSYLEMFTALRKKVPHIDYVDLRFGNRVYVRPVGLEGDSSGQQ